MNALDRIAGYAALKDALEGCCAFVKRLFLDELTWALLQKAVSSPARRSAPSPA